MSLLWTKGRFSWPFVAVVAYLSVSLVVGDYLWRVLVVPFDTLILILALADAAIALLLYIAYRLAVRRRT